MSKVSAKLWAHTGAMATKWQDKARSVMNAKKILQRDIADSLSVTEGSVSNWFSGRHQPSMDQLRKMAKMLGMSLSELIEEDDALARNELELDVLRRIRAVPDGRQDQAAALVAAVLATLTDQQAPPQS